MKLNIIYRISDGSYKKNRLEYATKEYCLQNFIYTFVDWETDHLAVLMDNCSEETTNMILKTLPNQQMWWTVQKINGGSSAQSFNLALDYALYLPNDEYVYLCEDDYIHWPESRKVLEEGLQRADYISCYDHPDKYINGHDGGNPHVEDGGEITRVFRTETCHWKLTNSTTMTWATSVRVLKVDETIWRKYTVGQYPRDFDAFIALRNAGRTLATPIPGYSTHTEVDWLTPYRDWRNV